MTANDNSWMPALTRDLAEEPEHLDPLQHRQHNGQHQRPATASAARGFFADPTPGVDAHGQPVHCLGCGIGLSQPRIDYGLDTCPGCRNPTTSTPSASATAMSTSAKQARS